MSNNTQFECPHCETKFSADLSMLSVGEGVMLSCENCDGDFLVSSDGTTLPFDPEERERLLNDLNDIEDAISNVPQITYGEAMTTVVASGDSVDSSLSIDDNRSNLICLDDDNLVEEIEYLLTFPSLKFTVDLRYLIGRYRTTGSLGKEGRQKIEECYTLAYSVGMRE